jgi:predicted transcriptional regulator
MKKLITSKEIIITNNETGEILLTEETKTFKLPAEPPFVKLYLDDLIKIKSLPKGNSAILYELIKLLNYEGQIILNGSIKKIIAKRLNTKRQTIDNALNQLLKKNIISRSAIGIYLLNPHLFAKRDWTNIRKLRDKYLELKITYKDEKKEIVAKIKE